MAEAQPHRSDEGGRRAQHLTLRDGTVMAYRDLGQGPALVLVHGWAASSEFFDTIADRLADEHRVLVPDLRGHGETPAGAGAASIADLADDMNEFLTALGLDRVVMLGWSMGATVLWSMIERHGSDRLAGMVIEDMSPRILNDESWALGMSSGMDVEASVRATAAMRADWPAYAAAFAPRMFARDRAAREPQIVADALTLLTARNADAMADLWASMAQQDLRASLPGMAIPALIAFGERSDAYGPETSRYLVETLPAATAHGFAHSGHAPHLEQPEEFVDAVKSFARQALAQATSKQTIEGSIS
ncbi:alpha/beta fold hydrolase [Maricaulis maris]|uniref:Pimeloyl-[acyl-carrier protein] methyl ester esterase n=1 Tax=Maricaulis maris TaxID=74318 RepID=A0A495D3E5_9PROT|nr:alpha/beta hydrolase [Maricaulis maris]RKQ96437.1 pimeloyl-[acyl-carrier protein] methyl ester esterase [Maricaulis maris]